MSIALSRRFVVLCLWLGVTLSVSGTHSNGKEAEIVALGKLTIIELQKQIEGICGVPPDKQRLGEAF